MIVASAPTSVQARQSYTFDGVALVDGAPVGEGWTITVSNLDSQSSWEADTNGEGYYNRVGQVQAGDMIQWEADPPAGEWLTHTVTTTLSQWDITQGGTELDLSYGSNAAAIATFDIGKVKNRDMEPFDLLTMPASKTINYGDDFKVKTHFLNDIDDPDETPDQVHQLVDTQWYYHETWVMLTVYQQSNDESTPPNTNAFLGQTNWISTGSKAKGGAHLVVDPNVAKTISSYWAQAPPPAEQGDMVGFGPNYQWEDGQGGTYYKIVAEVVMTIKVFLGDDNQGTRLYWDDAHLFNVVTMKLYINNIP